MRSLRWTVAGGLLACGLPVACAEPCVDDGLGQANCPSQGDGTDTEGATASNTNTMTATVTATMTATEAMTGSQTGDGTETDTSTDTAGGSLWCVDADGDGYGDPTMCQQSDEPIPGSVDNDDDCDDGNEHTFPGAAPNDDPRACMKDEDGDDWGDDDPPPGVVPGTDCDDGDATIAPGAAYNEVPPNLCMQDADGDGWGDNDPPPGVDPGTDCADDNPFAFPGAAPNDDPVACMQDVDGDDWGDDSPPPGIEPGTDCDDENAAAYPGAAYLETPPGLCTVDTDGDGWGDANPGGGGGGGGPVGGSDCYPTNPDLNPDTVQLTAFMPFNGGAMTPRTIASVNPNTAQLTPFITLQTAMGTNPNVNLVTATMDETGAILANDLTTDQLFSVEYQATCAMGTGVVTGLGPYDIPGVDDLVCGLEFDGDGNLYGIDNSDRFVTFDPATGAVVADVPITFNGAPLNISSCGMAYDCGQDRMLVANGINWRIYEIDTATGAATMLRDLDPFFGPAWNPVGLAWNPVSRIAYLSTGGNLYTVDVDNPAAPPVNEGAYGAGQQVSNLQYLPVCGP
jgi:hypothetical protein